MTESLNRVTARTEALAVSGAERASLRERMQRTAAARPFLAYLAIVATLAGVYYGLVATPLYVSEARFSVRSKGAAASSGMLSGLLGAPSGGLSDISAVAEYIGSQDMLHALQSRLDLRSVYAQPRIDPLQWLPRNASQERFHRFYRRHVIVRIDREANTVAVIVKSFDPKSAQQTASAVLELTEQFVNSMSQRLRDDSLTTATAELNAARAHAEEARQAVTEFRGQNADLDPSASGVALVHSLDVLQAQRVALLGQIAALATYSQPSSPAMQQAKAQLANIEAQIGVAKGRQNAESRRPQQMTTFETLQLARASAEKTLETAEGAHSGARLAAEQREKFVVRIIKPSLPQEAVSPDRMLEFLTTLVFAIAGYALVALTVAAIRDHRGI